MAEKGLDTRYNIINMLKLVRDQKYIDFAEVLTESNPLMQDMINQTANGILSHEGVRETSLPTPQIIKIGDGHDASTVKWDNYKEDISVFKDRIVIPMDDLSLMPDKAAFTSKVERRHYEGFAQGVCNHIIYGTSAANPEKFDGLDVRYKTPDNSGSPYDPTNPDPSTAADFAVFDATGTGSDTTSLWLIQHGVDKFCSITPINDPQAGIKMIDMGKQYASAENSKDRIEYRTDLEWKIGISIADIRAIARIRNIESAIASVSSAIISLIYQARNEIFRGQDTVFLYCARRMMTHFQILAEAKQNVMYDRNNPYDIPMYRIGDMPIRVMDAISITEAAVTAV